ncbi:hypothetical protein RMQ97_03735 [Maricaulis sp. D1M11]|uniref:hypothetical protein n=1 Tax=Maricaulis sp. D1M11 TaxID=3076117 RepID=UPI0039B48995
MFSQDLFSRADLISLIVRLLGLYFTASGVGTLINPANATKMAVELRDAAFLRFLFGVLAFLVGGIILAIQIDHSSVRGIAVTVFGWLALIQGLTLIALPGPLVNLLTSLTTHPLMLRGVALVLTVLGVWLIWLGFA